MPNTTEILSPAGSPEALYAAVAAGADAVYLAYGDFNARRMARNFSELELKSACDYCHKRGVLVYVTVNTLATDRELIRVEKLCREISRAGADAIICADLGIARLIRDVLPDMPIHASTQLTAHNLSAVCRLAEIGFSRVVLARELSRDDIRYITKNAPCETEVFVHGALCMCYSGQCELSAVIGSRSGNRGLCAQPCRLPYKMAETANAVYPLSLKDLCLADYITELSEAGVASLKIEGRMKRPEYVATVTEIYARLLREGRAPHNDERRRLTAIFSRDGFTDGYYTGKIGKDMFGIRTKGSEAPESLLSSARKLYENPEAVPAKLCDVELFCVIEPGKPAVCAASDSRGNRALARGPVPEPARSVALTAETVRAQLLKSGGTRFKISCINLKLSGGLSLPLSALNALRRSCLEQLERHYEQKPRREGSFNVGFKLVNRKEKPRFTVSVSNINQISDALLERDIAILYVPLTVIAENPDIIEAANKKIPVCAAFPRVIHDDEEGEISRLAKIANDIGIEFASVGNIGHISLAENAGFSVRADFGISVFNSHSLREVRRFGAISALLSPELTFPQIRDLSKIIDTEIFAYGRLPLMICENCVVNVQTGACVCKSHHALYDRTGAAFPLVPEFGHRTVVLNSQKLWLADKLSDFSSLGIAFARLSFTSENARECVSVVDSYFGGNLYAPSQYTRGLYYRGVE